MKRPCFDGYGRSIRQQGSQRRILTASVAAPRESRVGRGVRIGGEVVCMKKIRGGRLFTWRNMFLAMFYDVLT